MYVFQIDAGNTSKAQCFGLVSATADKEPLLAKLLSQEYTRLCEAQEKNDVVALQLSVAISQGDIFQDTLPSKIGCLYLDASNGFSTLKRQLSKILQDKSAPENLYIAVGAPFLDPSWIKKLNEELDMHPDVKFIVVADSQKALSRANHNKLFGDLLLLSRQKKISVLMIN